VAKKTLTNKFVETAPGPTGDGKQCDYWDAATPGLSLRVTSEGVKSWTVLYRVDGKQVRHTLGRYPGVGLADARRKAADARELVAGGKDPRREDERQRAAEAQARADTVEAVVQRYLASIGEVEVPGSKRKPQRLRSGREIARIFNRYIVPAIGRQPMKDVSRRQLVELLDKIADQNGGAMANRTLGQIRRLFNWAVSKDIVAASPCTAIERPAREVPRDRKLSDDEVRRVWAACDLAGQPYGQFIRFLLATGVRRSEAAFMTRSEIDGDVWVIPARRQKSNVEHAVPLSPLAVEIINSLPNRGGTVFALEGGGPMSGFSSRKAWFDNIVAADGDGAMEPWALHDIRRVVRSGMSALRIDPEIAERVLAHVPARLRRTYDRHSYLDEKRVALEAWARRLQSIVDPTPKGNVFELRATG
jgi:integrase